MAPRSPRVLVLVWLVLFAACGASTASPTETETADQTQALIDAAREAESRRAYFEAQDLYQRAKDAAPDASRRAHAARVYGRALIFYGEYERAATELEQAATLAPDDAGTWHDLGLVRHHLGRLDGAEHALRQARAIAPRDPRPRIALAALLMRASRLTEALEEYRAIRALPLPAPVREKVEWAVSTLEKRLASE